MKQKIKMNVYKDGAGEIKEFNEGFGIMGGDWKKIGTREIEFEDGIEETITVNQYTLIRLINRFCSRRDIKVAFQLHHAQSMFDDLKSGEV
jgi:hypothetical protein